MKLDKLDALLAQTSTSKQDAALFAEMLSLPNDGRYPALNMDPQQRRQKTLEALTAQLEALSRQKPVLMIFEDAHWTDPTSLETFGRVVDRVRSLPVLLIVTFRPEFEPPWIGRPYVTALTINRLAQHDIEAMIDRVVGNKLIPAGVRKDIIERTDGIPLFVEEMTKAVLEAGSEEEAQRTAATVPSTALAVPASLHASLMARLDRLGAAREVAQIGAAIGREFSHALLGFAAHLFDLTKLGMRVIVAPSDVAPASIEHPTLFQPKPDAREAAAARVAQAEEATKKADQARLAALAAWREVAQATIPLRRMQNLKLREEQRLADAEQAITSADSTEAKGLAKEAKARATAKVAELEAQLAAAEAELQPKRNAVVVARADAAAAEAARVAAVEAAGNAERAEPVSVFISRDTQRLYVRQALQPILDISVTIRDPELSIGTHVFTAVERADKRGMQWNVVSLVGGSSNIGTAETHGPTHNGPDGHAEEMDLFNAKAALDRIVIPEDTVDRIREMVLPRSSLIISDEGPSSETGRGTEFVIIMSGEPQGGLTNRRHRPEIGVRYEPRGDRYHWRSPPSGFYSTW